MLVVAPAFVPTRPVEHALVGREVSRQSCGSLIAQERFETCARLAVVAPPVQVRDHHARFVPERAVTERSHARETSFCVRLSLAVDQQMAGVCPVKLVQHRLGRDELHSFVQTPLPVFGDCFTLDVEIQTLEPFDLLSFQPDVGELDDDRVLRLRS